MDVKIKDLGIDLIVKSRGIEFEVRSTDGATQLGDLYVTMSGLIWCKGKTTKQNGKKISWEKFIDLVAAI